MPYDPVATLKADIDRIIGERDARKHRIAIKNVDKRIASLRFAPTGVHVTHLLEGKDRLEKSLRALVALSDAQGVGEAA